MIIWLRAGEFFFIFAESCRLQPDKPTWNLMGMLNNPWFRVKIRRCHKPNPIAGEGNGVLTVRFEHPTLAGNQAGGWMSDLKEHPSLTAPGVFVDPKTACEMPKIVHSTTDLH